MNFPLRPVLCLMGLTALVYSAVEAEPAWVAKSNTNAQLLLLMH